MRLKKKDWKKIWKDFENFVTEREAINRFPEWEEQIDIIEASVNKRLKEKKSESRP